MLIKIFYTVSAEFYFDYSAELLCYVHFHVYYATRNSKVLSVMTPENIFDFLIPSLLFANVIELIYNYERTVKADVLS